MPKFMEIGPLVPKKNILRLSPYMGKEAIWLCDQYYIYKFSFHCTKKLTYKIWSKKVKWFLRNTSSNFDMKMTLGQSQEMTLTLNTHILLSTDIVVHVTGFNSLKTIHCFHFLL